MQAAFTNPELVELTELADADLIVDPADLELDPASAAALEGDAMAQRNLAVLREVAAGAPEGKPRSLHLRFLSSPVALLGDGRVEAVEVVRNRLEAGADGRISAVATERARDDPLRHRLAQRRLPRRRHPRAAVRRAARRDPERRRSRPRRRGTPCRGSTRRAGSSAGRAA